MSIKKISELIVVQVCDAISRSSHDRVVGEMQHTLYAVAAGVHYEYVACMRCHTRNHGNDRDTLASRNKYASAFTVGKRLRERIRWLGADI